MATQIYLIGLTKNCFTNIVLLNKKMNRLDYYTRQKESWELPEIQELRYEYESKQMPITQIADIHKRTPGSISYKLKAMGIITNTTTSARGYSEYKSSDLYSEIVSANKSTKKSSTEESSTELSDLKKEILSLKEDVKELLRLVSSFCDPGPCE
jgi:hypothetical protein